MLISCYWGIPNPHGAEFFVFHKNLSPYLSPASRTEYLAYGSRVVNKEGGQFVEGDVRPCRGRRSTIRLWETKRGHWGSCQEQRAPGWITYLDLQLPSLKTVWTLKVWSWRPSVSRQSSLLPSFLRGQIDQILISKLFPHISWVLENQTNVNSSIFPVWPNMPNFNF